MDIISSIYVARLFAAVATGHFAMAARLNAHVALIRSSGPPRLGPAQTHPEVLMALLAADSGVGLNLRDALAACWRARTSNTLCSMKHENRQLFLSLAHIESHK